MSARKVIILRDKPFYFRDVKKAKKKALSFMISPFRYFVYMDVCQCPF